LNVRLIRLFGWFGIITPILGFSMIFIAISTAPWFSWEMNALSDLGVEGLTGALFNGGLMMTASVMAVFSLGIRELGKGDRLGKIGFLLLLWACIFLVAIGFWPETAGSIHLEVSIAFFVTLPLAMIVNAASLIRRGYRALGALGIVAGAVTMMIWALNWDGVAIPEAVAAGSAGVWTIVMGAWMTRYVERIHVEDLTE